MKNRFVLLGLVFVLLLVSSVNAQVTLQFDQEVPSPSNGQTMDTNGEGAAANFTVGNDFTFSLYEIFSGSGAGSPEVEVTIWDDSGSGGRPGVKLQSLTNVTFGSPAAGRINITFTSNYSYITNDVNWVAVICTSCDGSNNFGAFGGALDNQEWSTTADDGDTWGAPAVFPRWFKVYGETTFPVTVFNASLEQSFVDRQDAPLTIAGGEPVTIISDTFTIPVSNDHIYVTANLQVSPNNDNEITCDILFDGSTHGSTQVRSNLDGEAGSLFLSTSDISASSGDHVVELQCERSLPPGTMDISNGILILHNLINEFNVSLNNTFQQSNFSVPTSGFPVLDSFIFTTGNNTIGDNITRSVVINWDGQYSYDATGNISTEIRVQGLTNCSVYPRFGDILDEGVVGGECILKNTTTALQDLNITIHGNGSGDVSMNIHVKEFLIEKEQINTQLLTPSQNLVTAFRSTILISAFNMTVNNTDRTNANLFVKTGIPVKSNEGVALASCQLVIIGPKNFTGIIHNRTVDENGFGVLIVEDLFEEAPIGDYQVILFGSCDNGNCSTVPTELVAYFTDRQAFEPNFFEVTAQNNRTQVAINNFTMTNTNFFVNTTTGAINVTTNISFFNLTVSATNFFPTSIINHNTSLNITVNLTEFTIINATDNSGNSISTFTVNFTQIGNSSNTGAASTTNGQALIPLLNGNFTVSIFDASNSTSFFASASANLTAVNVLPSHTFVLFASNTFHLEVRYEINRTFVNDRNVSFELVSSIEALNFTSDNGTLSVTMLEPSIIDIRYSSDGFRERSFFFNLVNQTINNITLYMLADDDSSLIIITNVDETGTRIEGFTTQLLRGFIIDSVEVFEVVEMDLTDFAGEAVMSAELNDVRYIVRTVTNVSSNQIVFISNPFEITGSTLRVTLDLLADPLESFNSWRDIAFTGPTFDNVSNNWSATYNDVPGLINPGGIVCLIVEEQFGVDRIFFAQSCASGSIATLTVQYTGGRGSYAKLVADTNTENSIYVIEVGENLIDARSAVAAALGGSGAFWSAAILYGISTMLIFNPATYMYGMIVGLVSVWIIGFTSGAWAGIIALVIMGGIIITKLKT